MTITPIKAERVVGAVLGALQRDVVLPQLIWMDPAGDFTGAKNDTINLSIPAVTSARKRTMRAGTTRNRDSLAEGKVAVTLTTNLYKDVAITDEELTLDIADFGRQVLQPITTSMAEGWEEEIVDLMEGASYAKTTTWDGNDPQKVFANASRLLDDARVPMSGRFAVVGSGLAEEIVTADQVRRYDHAGPSNTTALQDASVPPLGGFSRIVKSAALDPDEGYCFHRTAYAGASKVPVVPDGVAWGTSMSSNGFAMRAMRHFDASADGWVDILGFDSFVGTNIVKDHGAFDPNGKFVPAESPQSNDSDLLFVRAVKIVGGGS